MLWDTALKVLDKGLSLLLQDSEPPKEEPPPPPPEPQRLPWWQEHCLKIYGVIALGGALALLIPVINYQIASHTSLEESLTRGKRKELSELVLSFFDGERERRTTEFHHLSLTITSIDFRTNTLETVYVVDIAGKPFSSLGLPPRADIPIGTGLTTAMLRKQCYHLPWVKQGENAFFVFAPIIGVDKTIKGVVSFVANPKFEVSIEENLNVLFQACKHLEIVASKLK